MSIGSGPARFRALGGCSTCTVGRFTMCDACWHPLTPCRITRDAAQRPFTIAGEDCGSRRRVSPAPQPAAEQMHFGRCRVPSSVNCFSELSSQVLGWAPWRPPPGLFWEVRTASTFAPCTRSYKIRSGPAQIKSIQFLSRGSYFYLLGLFALLRSLPAGRLAHFSNSNSPGRGNVFVDWWNFMLIVAGSPLRSGRRSSEESEPDYQTTELFGPIP